MSIFRHLRASAIALAALTLIVGLSACSKKDVKEDEPAFTSTGGDGLPAESAGTVGAGEAGGRAGVESQPRPDLRREEAPAGSRGGGGGKPEVARREFRPGAQSGQTVWKVSRDAHGPRGTGIGRPPSVPQFYWNSGNKSENGNSMNFPFPAASHLNPVTVRA